MNGTYEQCIELSRAIAGTDSTLTKGTISTSTRKCSCSIGWASEVLGKC